ncbi:MAG: hypothetical protein FJZ47_18550 [Candidatus Tectomicrobia bacterium]|uniref:Recombinase zinc beta ribbon domain-containing protein n=1 Tax=Tectimicrobiota bacterium TaxID=2528274 RepID=A0A938B3W8_UNCTE|nr:hypothetical protein [Candidatus Tectomicrobia bacterium]
MRAYAYYRCLGTDAYRFGGERVCQNTQARTDLFDLAVWREVCVLLAHPERLAEEYRRRLQEPTQTKHQEQHILDTQLGKVQQGLVRLIDSYAEGLIEKQECEPRITRLRQRLTQLEEQRQRLADAASVQTELRLIIGRLEEFAARVRAGLETADWLSQRELIRTLVKRVEVAQDLVHVVFRVDQAPLAPRLEKKVCKIVGGVVFLLWGVPEVPIHPGGGRPICIKLSRKSFIFNIGLLRPSRSGLRNLLRSETVFQGVMPRSSYEQVAVFQRPCP